MSSNRIATALAIGSVMAALGCLGYISLNGDTPRESYSNPSTPWPASPPPSVPSFWR
jgi:hypothetical protein